MFCHLFILLQTLKEHLSLCKGVSPALKTISSNLQSSTPWQLGRSLGDTSHAGGIWLLVWVDLLLHQTRPMQDSSGRLKRTETERKLRRA